MKCTKGRGDSAAAPCYDMERRAQLILQARQRARAWVLSCADPPPPVIKRVHVERTLSGDDGAIEAVRLGPGGSLPLDESASDSPAVDPPVTVALPLWGDIIEGLSRVIQSLEKDADVRGVWGTVGGSLYAALSARETRVSERIGVYAQEVFETLDAAVARARRAGNEACDAPSTRKVVKIPTRIREPSVSESTREEGVSSGGGATETEGSPSWLVLDPFLERLLKPEAGDIVALMRSFIGSFLRLDIAALEMVASDADVLEFEEEAEVDSSHGAGETDSSGDSDWGSGVGDSRDSLPGERGGSAPMHGAGSRNSAVVSHVEGGEARRCC
jgi:hypothetical protein